MPRFYLIENRFFTGADRLRRVFDDRFADPRQAHGERFVWDWWHVPDQYTHLRTPAYHYFPPRLYAGFHRRLLQWGRERLGCHDVSPPWLSLYVDGCRQEVHADIPHGPWAFVYSLTQWHPRRFRGGETLLIRPELLEFWRSYRSSRGLELDDVFTRLPSLYNRLLVFDPRLPHGVRTVEGTRDPRDGRLVIHGWFIQPQPYVDGPLPRRPAARILDEMLAETGPRLAAAAALRGTLSVRLHIDSDGSPRRVEPLTHTLVAIDGDTRAPGRAFATLRASLLALRFPRAPRPSRITLPVLFD